MGASPHNYAALVVILLEALFVLTFRLDLFYTQPWFDELNGPAQTDAVDYVDRLLAPATDKGHQT